MQRQSVFTAILLLSACDAAVNARAEAAPRPVVAEANVQADADGDAVVAVVADAGASVTAAGSAKVEIAADAFKLAEVTTLVQDGKIESAADLELAINDPEADINRIDIDVDGKIDHVQVVEVRNDAQVDFRLRVIPSSRATVEHSIDLATASVAAVKASSEVSFSASFSAGVSFTGGASASARVYSFVAPARFEASAVIVAQPLLAWAFVVERPVYASLFVEPRTGRWVPPGHVKHGLWKATGGSPGDKGHGGHGKFKGEGSLHGEARGGAGGKHHGKLEVGDDRGSDKHGGAGKGSAPKQANKSPSKPQASKSSTSGSKGGSSKGGEASKGGSAGGGGSKGGSVGGGGKGKK